jgi:hypothetical protein
MAGFLARLRPALLLAGFLLLLGALLSGVALAVTGDITTVAGTGTAGFSGDNGAAASAKLASPLGVAVDGAGNLFIADQSNHRIRKVDAATQVITTVAGTGTLGFSGDDGPRPAPS